MRDSPKVKVAVLLADPQSQRLIDLFASPEFKSTFDVVPIRLEALRLPLSVRSLLRTKQLRRHLRTSPSEPDSDLANLVVELDHNVSIVVGLDNQLSLLDRITRISEARLRTFAVQMGTNPRYYNPNLKDSRVSPVTLLAWGNRDKEEYTRGGLKPHRVVVVGSLMRALAFNSMKDMGGKYKPWDVCVVSQFRPKANPKSGVSESAIAEFTSMPLLLTLLSPILEKHKLRVVVALRSEKRLSSQISVTDERECFFRYLSCPFAFSDSNDLYSSYSAILNSRLTVGRNSGIMFECMSSDSRMLFVNPTTYKLFDPPTRWPFGLINPTSQQLETEIENLLLMPQERYQSARASIPEYFCLEAIDTLAAIRGVLLDSEARL